MTVKYNDRLQQFADTLEPEVGLYIGRIFSGVATMGTGGYIVPPKFRN